MICEEPEYSVDEGHPDHEKREARQNHNRDQEQKKRDQRHKKRSEY